MSFRFIENEPVLLYNKTLILADLHIGVEYELYKSGISVPTQIENMKKKIDSLIKKTRAKKIIFIGDIKHQVPGVSFQELKEIPEFFNYFSKKIETHIVLGNHDSEIIALVEDTEIHDTTGFKLDDIYILHGHAWPKKDFLECKYLIIAHTHPLIEIKEKIGYRHTERAWVKTKSDSKKVFKKYKKEKTINVILMPAFNELVGGVTLNKNDKPFGPITQLVDNDLTEVYLLDGTYLGKLESLQ